MKAVIMDFSEQLRLIDSLVVGYQGVGFCYARGTWVRFVRYTPFIMTGMYVPVHTGTVPRRTTTS